MTGRPSVTIVDYGRGNLLSVGRAFEQAGADVVITDDARVIAEAARVVVPGVGAFGDAMNELSARDLIEPLKSYAGTGLPILGVCVGMQILFDGGEEFGENAGLGLLPGSVTPIAGRSKMRLKIPHIGWDRLIPASSWDGTILAGLGDDPYCYFVHSFAAVPENPSDLLSQSVYGDITLTAAVRRGNVWGCQFHPEKSGPVGLKIISNFLELTRVS
ncbi:MAG: imidazole glycerol phosphate synthase subunit HisH [Rhodospirillaceae bacterium]|nr:imidazole glycerol phosphate synthase subunit HisH [Rhodospirillaceae bacterium]